MFEIEELSFKGNSVIMFENAHFDSMDFKRSQDMKNKKYIHVDRDIELQSPFQWTKAI